MILPFTKKNCSPNTKVEQACKEFDKQIEPKKKLVSIMLRNVKLICNGTLAILIRLKSSAAGRKLLLSVIHSATLMFSQRKRGETMHLFMVITIIAAAQNPVQ